MKAFLKLVRWPNLLIVAATQFLMRYAVMRPLLQNLNTWHDDHLVRFTDLDLQLPLAEFIFLVLATVLVTAGGYVINDYFDTRTDIINKGKVLVGTKISRRWTMLWHNILSFAGLLLGFYVSFRIGHWEYGLIFFFVSGMLWFYSTTYKKQFLLGNVVVALLTALVPILVVLYELPLLQIAYADLLVRYEVKLSLLFFWVGGFALFSFMLNLIREIVKDMEDFEGDMAYGRRTLPVALGQVNTRKVVTGLSLTTLLLMYVVWGLFLKDIPTLVYVSLFLSLPLLITCLRCLRANKKEDYHRISVLLKWIMLAGLLYSLFIWFFLDKMLTY